MRKLASIQRIKKLNPIKGADVIERATVLGWQLVVKKGDFEVGDYCVYCEIDSILPEKPTFEFLRARHFRIKTIRLRGQISQGIAFPLTIIDNWENLTLIEGLDVTELLGIVKYESPIQANMRGLVKGGFPGFIPKTDETRIQSVPDVLTRSENKGKVCYVAEKLDGTSVTYYVKDGEFGVCSRNLELKETEDNIYWQVARQEGIEDRLKKLNRNLAIQGEIIGMGVQGNKYKLTASKVFVFNVLDIDTYTYLDFEDFVTVASKLGLEIVPILRDDFILGDDNIDDLIYLSEGLSYLNDTHREGLVIRPLVEARDPELGRLSFKVINPKLLFLKT